MADHKNYKGVTRQGGVFILPENHELYADGQVIISYGETKIKAIVVEVDYKNKTRVHIIPYSLNGIDRIPVDNLTVLMTTVKKSNWIEETKKTDHD